MKYSQDVMLSHYLTRLIVFCYLLRTINFLHFTQYLNSSGTCKPTYVRQVFTISQGGMLSSFVEIINSIVVCLTRIMFTTLSLWILSGTWKAGTSDKVHIFIQVWLLANLRSCGCDWAEAHMPCVQRRIAWYSRLHTTIYIVLRNCGFKVDVRLHHGVYTIWALYIKLAPSLWAIICLMALRLWTLLAVTMYCIPWVKLSVLYQQTLPYMVKIADATMWLIGVVQLYFIRLPT